MRLGSKGYFIDSAKSGGLILVDLLFFLTTEALLAAELEQVQVQSISQAAG